MGFRDGRVDAYSARARPCARPILAQVRAAWHAASAEIRETIKWGIPIFELHCIVDGMGAFKAHVSAGFQRGKEPGDPDGILQRLGNSPMAGLRLADVDAMPARSKRIHRIRRAMVLDRKLARLSRLERSKATARRPARRTPPFSRRLCGRIPRRARPAHPSPARRDGVRWITSAR